MKRSGQGGIEYLVIILASLLVVAITVHHVETGISEVTTTIPLGGLIPIPPEPQTVINSSDVLLQVSAPNNNTLKISLTAKTEFKEFSVLLKTNNGSFKKDFGALKEGETREATFSNVNVNEPPIELWLIYVPEH